MITATRRPLILIVQASVLAACSLALSARAQIAPTPTPTPTPVAPVPNAGVPGGDKAVELSPFQVTSDNDVGYQAGNTTSGSRFNTSLKETAASISPFTPEFLSDISASNVNEMLAYATNAETHAGDSEGAGFNNPRDFSSAGGEPFRIRGIPGGVSVDYVENAAPIDFYNIGRVEIASGANSILFGSGDAGGLVSLSSKRADLQRSRYSGEARFGSWNEARYVTDLNQVLVPKKVALRVNALYGDTDTWRSFEFTDTKRYTAAITVQPFKWTTITANYQDGIEKKSVGLRWNPTDQVTKWIAKGRTVTDGAADVNVGTEVNNTNQRFTYVPQDGMVYNLRSELHTTTLPAVADTLLSPSIFPYNINWAGPETRLKRVFSDYQVVIDQRITSDLLVQAGYFHNKTDSRARSFVYTGNRLDLFGDPNLTIPAQNGTGTVINPRAGQLYLESNQNGDYTITENAIKRGTVAYELRLGDWFGDHRMAALYENAIQHRATASQREILVNQAGVPIANAAAPENVQNLIWRRNYLTEGNFNTYSLNGLYAPLAPFAYTNGSTLSPRQITSGELLSIKNVKSYMFAMQSSWLKSRLSTTLGYRRDDIVYSDTTSGRVLAGDARIASGQKILNEVAALPGYNRNDLTASTLTAGGVFHVTKRISVLYNQSTNHGAPRFDRRILPDGRIPGTPEGKNREYGAMIDVLGDDRFFARATYFETSQIGDAGVSPSGAVTNNTTALGRPQTLAVLNQFLSTGKITQAQFDAQSFNWNAAIIDTASKGIEFEFIGNPNKNITFRLNYSHSLRDRQNFFAEGIAFFNAKAPEWRTTAGSDAATLAVVETQLASIFSEIADRAAQNEQGNGSIPHKATATARYKFTDGKLKGLFMGGASRFQSKAFSQTDTRAASAGGTGKSYYANQTLFFDAFAGYTFSPWHKYQMRVQINVKNLTNSYLETTARYNADFSGARRIYLNDPRQYRLTASVDF